MDELFLILLIVAVIVGIPLAAIVLSIVALVRSKKIADLSRRLEQLEAAAEPEKPKPIPPVRTPEPIPAVVIPAVEKVRPVRKPIQWELLIGQKALGWAAVVLFIFAAAFFLRYAYQNNWIGPVGRVTIGALVGAVLIAAGHRYHRRGLHIFEQMFSAAGVVVLYLATYSAFGFYHLLPQQHAGIFLAIIVIESMIIAALYDSLTIGLVAVLGGLLTPILLQTDRDSYRELFTYLSVLDLGVVVLMLLRCWPAIGSVALLGSQALFWQWYGGNYHPEKLAWAMGFQVAVYGVFFGRLVIAQFVRKQTETWEGLAQLVVNAVLWFTAYYLLTYDNYRDWMGSAALVMAIVYAVLARIAFTRRPEDHRLLLCCLAVSIGFIAFAFSVQADARWVAFGWSAMAASLCWFGHRVAAPTLRIMAAVLASCSVWRLLIFDLPHGTREPFVPVLNEFGLSSIGVPLCLLGAVVATRRFMSSSIRSERILFAFSGLTGVLLLWLILSIECYEYFYAMTVLPGANVERLRWLGQLSLSILWALFASAVLTIGFRIDQARLRWLAIVLYGVTVAKVLLIDIANLRQIYRILAFFILAIVLGIAARAYRELRRHEPEESKGANDEPA